MISVHDYELYGYSVSMRDLTQAQVAERMGTQAPAVARLERALATGRHSPSVATLRKYVKACGKRLVLRVA